MLKNKEIEKPANLAVTGIQSNRYRKGNHMDKETTAKELLNEFPSGTIVEDNRGKYLWVYELPMLKSFFLLFEVWKVLAIGALAVFAILFMLALVGGKGLDGVLAALEMGCLVYAILLILSIPAYYIVTKANNGKYTVLFEMDDAGIDHIQIKTEKAKALELLTTFVGLKTKTRTTTAAGMLAASGGSLYTRFDNVQKIRAYRKDNLITVNGSLFRNQIYVNDEEFDFVYDYIRQHCPQADIG